MWKPTNTLPDGSPVELPDDVQSDIQAAVYYGGLTTALMSDLTEGNLPQDQVAKAVDLGQEIAGKYGLNSLSDAISFAAMLAGCDDDKRPSPEMTGSDGDPIFGDDDSFTERHADSHRARRAA